jgi:7 transmembrane receptor (rhodopsin family)
MEDASIMIETRLTLNNSYYNATALNTTTEYDGNNEMYFNADEINRDPFYVVIPMTLIYSLIFVTGIIGNISTCIVISRNKSMHTATNYYLFSLAISDFVLLISGVPMELYHIWYKHEFIFGEAFCILRNAINEMSANATVLTSKWVALVINCN